MTVTAKEIEVVSPGDEHGPHRAPDGETPVLGLAAYDQGAIAVWLLAHSNPEDGQDTCASRSPDPRTTRRALRPRRCARPDTRARDLCGELLGSPPLAVSSRTPERCFRTTRRASSRRSRLTTLPRRLPL